MKSETAGGELSALDRLSSAVVLVFMLLAVAFTATSIWAIVRVVLFYT